MNEREIVELNINDENNPPYAGFIRRTLAFLIDHLIIIIFILFILIYLPGNYIYKFFMDSSSFASTIFIMILFLQIYFLIFELLTKGLTPGKWIFNIRVVNEEFEIPDFYSLVIRNFSRCLYFIPPFFILIDIVAFIVTINKRRVGDILAKTFVVKK